MEAVSVDHSHLFQALAAICPVELGRMEHPASYLKSWREEQFCEYGNARMIRMERYKFIRCFAPYAPASPNELYDLHEVPRETYNCIGDPALAGTQKELLQTLGAHLSRHEIPKRSGMKILNLLVYRA